MRETRLERLELYEYDRLLLLPHTKESERLIEDLIEELRRCDENRYEVSKWHRISYYLRDKRLRVYGFSCGFMVALLDEDGRINPSDIIYLYRAMVHEVIVYVLRGMIDSLKSRNCLTAVNLMESLLKSYKELNVGIAFSSGD